MCTNELDSFLFAQGNSGFFFFIIQTQAPGIRIDGMMGIRFVIVLHPIRDYITGSIIMIQFLRSMTSYWCATGWHIQLRSSYKAYILGWQVCTIELEVDSPAAIRQQ